ncbi:hypothetical protein T07_6247 [Trichinella nelsoni]|uniref:Uncharacterized protein n=1 Tax=Trichinella nelsoni TaxID=6336 RepID=A0A0V0SHQ1_9BILA|nr:hypothetical protein T07_6247 [Trichinella nelsoni]
MKVKNNSCKKTFIFLDEKIDGSVVSINEAIPCSQWLKSYIIFCVYINKYANKRLPDTFTILNEYFSADSFNPNYPVPVE